MFLTFDAVLIILFIAGYAARYVHPRHLWWLQLVAVVLPFLSMALIVPVVVAALLGKWKLLGVHALLGVLVLIRFVPFDRIRPRTAAVSEPLTVMTYNGKFKDSIAASRTGSARDLLDGPNRPDLVALQETYVKFVGDQIQLYYPPDTTWFVDDFGYTTRRPEELLGDRLYQPILGRQNIEELTLLWLYNETSRESAVSMTRVRFRWQGREGALYNVHLHSFNLKPWRGNKKGWHPQFWLEMLRAYRRDFRIRAYHAEQLSLLLAQETLPFIVCGDFNSTPHHWVYRYLKGGLHDAFGEAGRGWGATYHTRLPLVRIDFLFVSSAFQVHTARVAAAAFSDHLPLVVTLGWRGE